MSHSSPIDVLVEQAARPPAVPTVVVPASTPVVSFGDPTSAAVVTLGLNPSTRQFVRQNGALREGTERRLATLPSLGLAGWHELDRAAAEHIVAECRGYFAPGRAPYRRWFDPLDRVLRTGTGSSYYDGSACHLNLVAWATDPVWRGLDRRAWQRLVDADLPFLVAVLRSGGQGTVVVNGRTTMDEVAAAGLVDWTADRVLDGPPRTRLCLGESPEGVRYAGWTCNLQNQPGAARLAGELAAWLRAVGGRARWPRGARREGAPSTISHRR